MSSYRILFALILYYIIALLDTNNANSNRLKDPAVFIVILVRNKGHTLPYFLTSLSLLKYPKDRISIRIRSDHNEDHSHQVLRKWIAAYQHQYHNIDVEMNNSTDRFADEVGIASWPESRFKTLIKLRENALYYARFAWADYVWFLDCDLFFINSDILHKLIEKNETVVAPLLISNGMYSNFWAGMSSTYYYVRTEEYLKILNREKTGCFIVPMVHSATLIDLNVAASDFLTFDPNKIVDFNGPTDDIIAFAVGANKSNVPLHVCNDLIYGYITIPLEEGEDLLDDKNNFVDLKLFINGDRPPLPIDTMFLEFVDVPQAKKFGFDEIFVINLKRRQERRIRMEYNLKELGIEAYFVDAVDGLNLSDDKLNEMGIKLMEDYEDPYYKRPMKKGEIGCFLSHYNVWLKMVQDDLEKVIILEDDVRFEKRFVQKLMQLIGEIDRPSVAWDLVYLGRKPMNPKAEILVEDSNYLAYPDYSYWTIGYILNQRGARKLLDAKPLTNLLPVDEFLPIMFDKHPKNDWKLHFENRNLIALSVNPLIVFPVKYTHDVGYVSDTEDSNIVNFRNVKGRSEL